MLCVVLEEREGGREVGEREGERWERGREREGEGGREGERGRERGREGERQRGEYGVMQSQEGTFETYTHVHDNRQHVVMLY